MWNKPCDGYGTKLVELREAVGISSEELAFLIGTDINFIKNVEMSKAHPSEYFIKKLANTFQMDPTELKKYIWCEEGSKECVKIRNVRGITVWILFYLLFLSLLYCCYRYIC